MMLANAASTKTLMKETSKHFFYVTKRTLAQTLQMAQSDPNQLMYEAYKRMYQALGVRY